MKTQLDDWLIRRLMAGWTPKALAAASDGRISERTFYRWRKALGLEVVEMGGYRATFVLRGNGPPSQLRSWQRIVDKALAPADDGGTLSPETERPAQWGEPTPDRIALVVLTTDPVHTGYQSRKSQARRFCRTGASPVRASRERAADPLPRTHENPRPVGLGDESGLSDARHAVTTDLGALSLP